MAKPKIPSSRKAYNALNKRTERYIDLLMQAYEMYNKDAAKIALRTSYSGDEPFNFSDFPETTAAVKKLRKEFAANLNTTIVKAVTTEWDNSNKFNDQLVKSVLKKYGANAGVKEFQKYFNNNDTALKAFVNRKNKRFNLSANIWNQSNDYIKGLETAISVGIEKGMSAVTLSKRISKYLIDFDTLKKDYTDRYGKSRHIKDCEYRSARLARTEINMAYRTADNTRWQQLDFVVGYEIKRSGRKYDCPVCESLAGKYPKDFLFAGWHPNCRCYQISILNTEDEFWDDAKESVNAVKDVPDNFKQWVADNQDRIEIANNRGTLPYFLKDNATFAGINVNPINTSAQSEIRKVALQKYNLYGSEWNKVYFDEYSGGFCVYHEDHKFTKAGGGGDAEKIVGKMLAKQNGKQVEFLPELEKRSADLRFDGQSWDVKFIDCANEETIRKAIRDAVKADNAIFYFTNESKYLSLISAIERESGKFLKGQTDMMPDIYYMDKSGILKLLWEKQKGAK